MECDVSGGGDDGYCDGAEVDAGGANGTRSSSSSPPSLPSLPSSPSVASEMPPVSPASLSRWPRRRRRFRFRGAAPSMVRSVVSPRGSASPSARTTLSVGTMLDSTGQPVVLSDVVAQRMP